MKSLYDKLSYARIIPREVAFLLVFMKNKAYIAGFLDADGSIYVQVKKNSTYRYNFQIATNIVFYQSAKNEKFMIDLGKMIGYGYLRRRNDGIVEHIIGDEDSIRNFLENIAPELHLKRQQACLMIRILDQKKRISSAQEFLSLVREIDQFQELNYSKKRKNTASVVQKEFHKEGMLTP